MTTLATEQFQKGLPIQTGEDVVSPVQYLSALGSTPSASIPTSDYFVHAPRLQWTNCTSTPGATLMTAAGGAAGTGVSVAPPGLSLDLEATAGAIIVPEDMQLFANVSQGTTNMCTSMAFAQGYTLKYVLQHTHADFEAPGATVPQLSAVFAYYFQRVEECRVFQTCKCMTCAAVPTCTDPCNPPCSDCGSYLLSAATVFSNGVCLTSAWPYSKVQGDLNTLPDPAARANALLFKITSLACVTIDGPGGATPATITASLAAQHPVVVFLNLTPLQVRWMQAQSIGAPTSTPVTALVLPGAGAGAGSSSGPGSAPATVGHAVLIDGVDTSAALFTARNNFGTGWGVQGRFCIRFRDMCAPQVHSAVSIFDVCGPAPAVVATATTSSCP
jgi:hypothetical protein